MVFLESARQPGMEKSLFVWDEVKRQEIATNFGLKNVFTDFIMNDQWSRSLLGHPRGLSGVGPQSLRFFLGEGGSDLQGLLPPGSP